MWANYNTPCTNCQGVLFKYFNKLCRNFLLADRFQGEIDAVDYEADAKYRENHRNRHNFVRQEREDAGFNEEPVVAPVIDGVAERCPNENQQNTNEFFPDVAETASHIAIG